MFLKKKTLLLVLFLLCIFSLTVLAGPAQQIDQLEFKNADLADVLRTVATAADVNLITDSSVDGKITVTLKGISFAKALDLITQTKGLAYKWDDNTVVVAAPEKINSIYANITTEFVKANQNELENIGTIIRQLFPETQITLDPVRGQFILKGEAEQLNEIKTMIAELSSETPVSQPQTESKQLNESNIELYSANYQVLNAELEDLQSKLLVVNPALQIKINPLTNQITISGRQPEVNTALAMAKTYDESLEPTTENIRVDYVDTEQINEILTAFYPEIKVHVNQKRKEVIINGPRNQLANVESLIKSINKPRYQVVIETRVEEISTDFSREIGMDYASDGGIGTINIERNSDGDKINKLSYTWAEIFKLLDNSSDAKTLAKPSLMTLNGEEANMEILNKEPYEVTEDDDEGDTTTSWEYAEAGVKLKFTPWITENNEIEMKIAPEVSNFTENNAETASSDKTPPPATQTRKVETSLRLKNNETFAISGLIQTDKEGGIAKIPFFGDIPLLGKLFTHQTKGNKTNEIIIFVTPKIIKYGDEVSSKNVIKSSNFNLELGNSSNSSEPKAQVEQEVQLDNPSQPKTAATETVESVEPPAPPVKEDIIADYLAEKAQSREEILAQLSQNKEKQQYQDLTAAELEAILNK